MRFKLIATLMLLGVFLCGSTDVLVAQQPNEETPPLELRFERPFMVMVPTPPVERRGGFTITLNATGFTAPQLATFTDAKAAWEARIQGYQPGVGLAGLTINASSVAIDGPGGILGQAGPTNITGSGGFVLTTVGIMEFDSADLPGLGASLGAVIEHEMGHVLGIGTLWGSNGVYVNDSFQYTGTEGLAAWVAGFSGQAAAIWVPVEDDGGPGTANGHWNENAGGGGTVGISELSSGMDMKFELMTGWLSTPIFYSSLTHNSLRDIGFDVTGGGIFEDSFESGDTTAWN